MTPTQSRIAVDNRGLHLHLYTWCGGESQVPIVILHGFLDTGHSFAPLAQALASQGQARVLVPDQRGHGLSDHVGAGGFYHFPDYVADLAALLDKTCDGPVDLMGHSMGGTVATMFAAACPTQVRRLVLMEGLGPPNSEGQALERLTSHVRTRRHPPTHRTFPHIADAVARLREKNPSMSREMSQEIAQRLTKPSPVGDGIVWRWDALHRAKSPIPFQLSRHLQYLRAIKVPILLIDGEASAYTSTIDPHGQRMAAIPHARRVVLHGAGHMMHHDRSDDLATHLVSFLRS